MNVEVWVHDSLFPGWTYESENKLLILIAGFAMIEPHYQHVFHMKKMHKQHVFQIMR